MVSTGAGLTTATGALANQITTTGILNAIATLATTNGYLVKNGSTTEARTLTGTANQIAITNGDGTTGNPVFSLAAPVRVPTNPAFQAYNANPVVNVTGDGTTFEVTWDTESYDRGTNFADPAFTAPVTGKYLLTVKFAVIGLTTYVQSTTQIVTSNRTIKELIAFVPTSGTSCSTSIEIIVDMDAADTATYTLAVSGNGSDAGDILGAADLRNAVSGSLIC